MAHTREARVDPMDYPGKFAELYPMWLEQELTKRGIQFEPPPSLFTIPTGDEVLNRMKTPFEVEQDAATGELVVRQGTA